MSLDLGIKGKTALVVGASRGVGRAVALKLADEGCQVVAVARSYELLETLNHSNNIFIHAVDLMAYRAAEEFAYFCKRYCGYPDIIYYCIGGSYGDIKQWNASAEDYQRVWQFNLGIAIELNNAFVPYMLEKKWGRVVMTSTDGTKCNSGNVPYTSAKFALEGYVKTVSKQWAKDNVILTAVAPGHVYTPGRFMYSQDEAWTKEYMKHHAPIERWASDEEIAKVVTFLCSEGASYMAGSVVRVDGGSR
jgi:NAD(P)-dependent dehydrogenase (short-subunit alcohol dehydrogenase family)